MIRFLIALPRRAAAPAAVPRASGRWNRSDAVESKAPEWLLKTALAAVACFIAVSVWSSNLFFPILISPLALHALGFAALSALAFASWPNRPLRVFAVLIAIAIITELGQAFVPLRSVEVLDGLANLLGIAGGWLCTLFWNSKRLKMKRWPQSA